MQSPTRDGSSFMRIPATPAQQAMAVKWLGSARKPQQPGADGTSERLGSKKSDKPKVEKVTIPFENDVFAKFKRQTLINSKSSAST